MCMYVTSTPSDGYPYVVHPTSSQPFPPAGMQEPVSNSIYADSTTPISEILVGIDTTSRLPSSEVYVDQVFPIGTSGQYEKTSLLGLLSREFAKKGHFGDTQFYGYSSCQWLRHALTTEMVGSPCSATLSNVLYNGFVFESDTGSYECGRLAALDDQYGEKPITFDTAAVTPPSSGVASVTVIPSTPGESMTPYACSHGSPAKGTGTFVSTRLLIAGCMVTSDSNYSIIADVHVPGYCAAEADYMVGCMDPVGSNYDPAAKQVGPCSYKTPGCTDPTAVNYNAEATEDDASCIATVAGCTVQSTTYLGGESGTPEYRSSFYASNVRTQGRSAGLFEGTYGGVAVTNYNPAANVNSGCIVAIEGCMTPGAVNYDPQATINSGTWCVPSVQGCMMPPDLPGMTPAQGKETGLSTNWDVAATVHDAAMCKHDANQALAISRYGCMDETAVNYDPAATVSHTGTYYRCYFELEGCLAPGALNFGCTQRGGAACTDPPLDPPVTLHNAWKCTYPNEPVAGAPTPPAPSPPPRAPLPAGQRYATVQTFFVTTVISLSGDINTLVLQKTILVTQFSSLTDGVDFDATLAYFLASDGTIHGCAEGVECSRRRLAESRQLSESQQAYALTMREEVSSEAAAAARQAVVAAATASITQASFQAAVEAAGVDNIRVLNAPTVAVTVETEYVAEDIPSEEDNSGAVIGAVVGSIAGVLLIGGAVFMYKKRMDLQSKTTTVVPA